MNEKTLVSTYDVLKEFADAYVVGSKWAEDIKNGKINIMSGDFSRDKLLVVDESKQVLAMYVKSEGRYRFARGLF